MALYVIFDDDGIGLAFGTPESASQFDQFRGKRVRLIKNDTMPPDALGGHFNFTNQTWQPGPPTGRALIHLHQERTEEAFTAIQKDINPIRAFLTDNHEHEEDAEEALKALHRWNMMLFWGVRNFVDSTNPKRVEAHKKASVEIYRGLESEITKRFEFLAFGAGPPRLNEERFSECRERYATSTLSPGSTLYNDVFDVDMFTRRLNEAGEEADIFTYLSRGGRVPNPKPAFGVYV